MPFNALHSAACVCVEINTNKRRSVGIFCLDNLSPLTFGVVVVELNAFELFHKSNTFFVELERTQKLAQLSLSCEFCLHH